MTELTINPMITPVEREMTTKIKATRFLKDVFIRLTFTRKKMKSKGGEFHDRMSQKR
jgi:hypothetical protein